LYSIIVELDVLMKLIMRIKIYLSEPSAEVPIGEQLFYDFLLRKICNKEMLYRHCFSTYLYNMSFGI
jgi:hypothetical protein